MNRPEGPTAVAAMLAQLLADFDAGLSAARLEHALGRLRSGELVEPVGERQDPIEPGGAASE